MARERKKGEPYWQRTRETIQGALDYALEKGVRLGLENRERFEELPLDADFPGLLAGLKPPAPVGYWHDVGHAQIKQQMGLIDHRQQLAVNASRILGFHLHDVSEDGHDHQPIGSGCIDFRMVREFWRPEHRLVLEINPRASVEEVLESKRRLEALAAR